MSWFIADWESPYIVPYTVNPWKEIEEEKEKSKDNYTSEDLQSLMNSIKTRLIILCEMRGL